MYISEIPKQHTKCIKISMDRKHSNSCINLVFMLSTIPQITMIIKRTFRMFFHNSGYHPILILSLFKLLEWNKMLCPNRLLIKLLVLGTSVVIQYLYPQYMDFIILILNSATLWFNFIYKFLSNKKLLRILPCQIFHLS